LHELGYVEGKNIVIEYRPADRTGGIAGFAAELVGLNVDVIVAPCVDFSASKSQAVTCS
jgi:hypothetical protein